MEQFVTFNGKSVRLLINERGNTLINIGDLENALECSISKERVIKLEEENYIPAAAFPAVLFGIDSENLEIQSKINAFCERVFENLYNEVSANTEPVETAQTRLQIQNQLKNIDFELKDETARLENLNRVYNSIKSKKNDEAGNAIAKLQKKNEIEAQKKVVTEIAAKKEVIERNLASVGAAPNPVSNMLYNIFQPIK